MDDGASPPRFDSDDDDNLEDTKLDVKFEDAGALDMSAAKDSILLTRMPRFTWDALSELKDDDEVQVGTIRIKGDRHDPKKLSLMLDRNLRQFELVPREYNLHVLNKDQSNTFVFTEKDLPGFNRKMAGQGTQTSKTLSVVDKKETPHLRNHRMPGYKKAIPKKTALIGHVKSEYNCMPVENADYVNVLKRRHDEIPQDDLVPTDLGVQQISSLHGTSSSFTSFAGPVSTRQKKQQQKAARMPKNELLDMLFECFKEYKYWHLKDLRSRTMQPESYLREVLDSIAELVRQGASANTWRLKQTGPDGGFDTSAFADAQEAVAPARPELDDLSDEDEDEKNVKMEDV